MLVSEIITSSMRKLGLLASGKTPTVAEYADGLEALQVMLRSWASEKINVFSSVSETHTLVAGTSSYTWGVGGTISTLRPNQVIGVSILDSGGTTHSVNIISEGEYRAIGSKAISGRPHALFAQYGFPYVTIYLYPVPNAAETLNLDSLKPFTQTSSFAATSDTIQVPVNYEEPLIYNLAIRLGPEFGKEIPVGVAKIAKDSFDRITIRNAANYVEPIKLSLPVNATGGYSIDRG